MTDFFLWRGCDLSGTGVRETLKRFNDMSNRAIALLNRPDGLPEDSGTPSDFGGPPAPTLDIISASWCGLSNTGLGTLPVGTHKYKLIPTDTCSGRTGAPYDLPDLTISTLGEQATLCVTFGSPPDTCTSALLQRDGVLVGALIPLPEQMLDNFPITNQLETTGQYNNGTVDSFDIVSGADLQVDDIVKLPGEQVVTVIGVDGSTVSFTPPLRVKEEPRETNYNDLGDRTGFYISSPLNIPPYPVGFQYIGLYENQIATASITAADGSTMTISGLSGMKKSMKDRRLAVLGAGHVNNNGKFKITEVLSSTSVKVANPVAVAPDANNGFIGVALVPIAEPKTGDLINWGSKTALVTAFNDSTSVASLLSFGLLPIPPFPIGTFQLVYRPKQTPAYGSAQLPAAIGNLAATASFTVVDGSLLSDGETFTLDDGIHQPVTFEFDSDNSVVQSDTLRKVPFSATDTTADVCSSIENAINGSPVLYFMATSADPVVNVESFNRFSDPQAPVPGAHVNTTITDTVADTGFNTPNAVFTGGTGDQYLVSISPTIAVSPPEGVRIAIHDTVTTAMRVVGNVITVDPPMTTAGGGATSYLTLPTGPGDEAQIVDKASIPANGDYERLSRLTETTTNNSLFQMIELGTNQERTGDIGIEASYAKQDLDGALNQAGYAGGLANLTAKVRGPTATLVNRSFNNTMGTFVQSTPNGPYYAVNQTAQAGGGVIINVDDVRALNQVIGDYALTRGISAKLLADGYAVLRVEQRVRVIVPADCPPGQTGTQVVEQIPVAVATKTAPVRTTELARVFWLEDDARLAANARLKLRELGLTDSEAESAVNLLVSDRLLSVMEVRSDTLTGVTTDLGDILDDDRIRLLDPGPIVLAHVDNALRLRGVAGIAKRPLNTDPDQTVVVDDFALLAQNLVPVVLKLSCNELLDAAIAASPGVAGAVAVIEGALEAVITALQNFLNFWNESLFADFKDAVAGLLNMISADPTLGCLMGPMNIPGFNIPQFIPNLEANLLSISDQTTRRFDLMRLLFSVLDSILCAALDAVLKLLPSDAAQTAQHLIGCLPTSFGNALDFSIPLEVQLLFECNLGRINVLIRLIRDIIAEIREVIGFINTFGQGFIFRSTAARNQACAGDLNLATAVAAAATALGLPGPAVAGLAGVTGTITAATVGT